MTTPPSRPASGTASLAALIASLPHELETSGLMGRILDNLPTAVAIIDTADGCRVLYSNPALDAILDVREEVVGKRLTEVLHSAFGNGLPELLRGVATQGRPLHLERHRYVGLRAATVQLPGNVTLWNLDVHPLIENDSAAGLVLLVQADVTADEVRRHRMRALLDSTNALLQPMTTDQLPVVAVEHALRLLPGFDVTVGLVRPGMQGEIFVAAGSPPWVRLLSGRSFPLRGGPATQAINQGRPYETLDGAAEVPVLADAGLEAMRLIPLNSGGELSDGRRFLGVLSFYHPRTVRLDDELREVMDEFARRLAMALHRAELLAAAERNARRLQLGVDAAIDLAAQLDLTTIRHHLLHRALDAVAADRCAWGMIEGSDLVVEASLDRGGGPVQSHVRWSLADQPMFRQALTARAAVQQRGIRIETAPQSVRAAFEDARFLAAAPLTLDESSSGLVVAMRRSDIPFDDDDLATMNQLAGIAVLALNNARLFESSQAAARAKADFMNMAAHELRTPLSVITGYLSLLADGSLGEPPERWRRPIDVLSRKSEELRSLVEELLVAASLQFDSREPSGTAADLGGIVRDAADRIAPRATLANAQIAIEVVAAREPLMVRGNTADLARIVDNLLNNALAYSNGAPWVRITLGQARGYAWLTIEDRGRGIPRDHHERIFEQFHRVEDPNAGFPPGVGLGLYISRQLALRHGGSLDLQRSAPGEGSTFRLELPLSDPSGR